MATNRVDAIAGLLGLLAGFLLQAIGYTVALATPHQSRTGGGVALVAVGFGVLALAITLLCGRLFRQWRLVPTLVEMSHYTMTERLAHPQAAELTGWLRVTGRTPRTSEGDGPFLKRVAGVETAIVRTGDGRTRPSAILPSTGSELQAPQDAHGGKAPSATELPR